MGPNPKKVYVVGRTDSPRPEAALPGDVILSRTQFKKHQRRQQAQERTLLVVCRFCWADGHGEHRAASNTGAMRKDKKTGLYEHLDYCDGRRIYDLRRDAIG